jgi:hypothetical protein
MFSSERSNSTRRADTDAQAKITAAKTSSQPRRRTNAAAKRAIGGE